MYVAIRTILCATQTQSLQKAFFPDLAFYKTSLKISATEVVAYKTSLFNIFTPKWLLIRPYGDFVSVVNFKSFKKATEMTR